MEPDAKTLGEAVQDVRRLIAHLRKTTAPADLLESVHADVAALCERLAPFDHPGPYAQRCLDIAREPAWDDGETPARFFPYSPVIGPLNPIAPPVEFELRDREIHAEHVFDAPYNGPPTAVHGGVIALVFDELLGTLGAMSDVGGFTGTLTIRYRSLTPIGSPIRMRGWIDRTEGRKTFISGTMHHGETLCSEAEGIFVRPKESILDDALKQHAKGSA
jgi:hypothetical protein